MVSDFCSWLEGELELDVSLEEPVPAEPLVLLEELGLDDEAPPPDWLFCVSELLDDELDGEELEGDVAEPDMELELEPDGLDGVVAPLEDDEDGEVDDGLEDVVPLEEPVELLPPRSHAVSRLAPSAMETAIASVDILMRPPWLGYSGLSKYWAGRLTLNHLFVTYRRRRLCAFRTSRIAALLKIAALLGMVRVDLLLVGIGAVARVFAVPGAIVHRGLHRGGAARRAGSRRGARLRRRRGRRTIPVARRERRCERNSSGYRQEFHRTLLSLNAADFLQTACPGSPATSYHRAS